MNDKNSLKAVAQVLLKRLLPTPPGVRLRPRVNLKDSYTKGWRVELGGMGAGRPRLELWFDHWADGKKRRFWYGFSSRRPPQIGVLIRALPAYLQPRRTFKDEDMETIDFQSVLKMPLTINEFGPAFDEYYKQDGTAFYGKFDLTLPNKTTSIAQIADQAAAFFRDVLQHQRDYRRQDNGDEEIYPRTENRIVVRRHLSRERNSALATHCKIRDDYKCQVCGMAFELVYGKIGRGFAEAHHVIPLHQLTKTVKSSPKDLITVCSNCHRMLHKLRGKAGDVRKLKRIMRESSSRMAYLKRIDRYG